ncbi:MAG: resolvase protein [uncultured bacterium]|nr:MAG: resolvase protein [uncultured bacterium]
MNTQNTGTQRNETTQVVAKAKYVLYARKSTESDEKQALSIDSQIKEMLRIAEKDNLEIVDILKESHSAKDSGQRPVFNEILKNIRSGRYTGLLTWAPDRLSRNAGDLGSLVDLMDQKLLWEIRTYSQNFTNSPNEKFMLMLLCSTAKLENDNKSENVKRGLRTRCEMGLWPNVAPTGYLNHPDKTMKCHILLDPHRSHVIKIMFEKVAYEKWSGRDLYKWLKDDQKFKSRGDKPLSLSNIFLILKNPFYCGLLEYPKKSGKWYIGKHEPIISQELFKKVQEKFDTKKSRGPVNNEFAFTRLMKCGLCNSGICAQEKFKNLANGGQNKYIYYGCTKFHDKYCKNTYLREEDLISQLVDIVDKIDLSTIGIKQKLEQEMSRFNNFRNKVLGLSEEQKTKQSGLDLRAYAKYLLKEGSLEEKRELMQSFTSKLLLINKQVVLE